MKLLCLLALVAVAAANNIVTIENDADSGNLHVQTAPGKNIGLMPGEEGMTSIFGVKFSQKELMKLKKLVNDQLVADKSLGSAILPDEAGVSVKDGVVYLGSAAGKVYFTSSKTIEVNEISKDGKRLWEPSEVTVRVGDTIKFTWNNLESIIETDSSWDQFTAEECEERGGCVSSGDAPSLGGEYSLTVLKGPATTYIGSRNTDSMRLKINIVASGFNADGAAIVQDVVVSGDVSIGGDIMGDSMEGFNTKVTEAVNELKEAFNGRWGANDQPIRDWIMQTREIRTNTYHGNGWRCRDPWIGCSGGKRVIGGGCSTHCHGSDRDQGVAESYPESNGWRCRGDIYHYMTAYVICA